MASSLLPPLLKEIDLLSQATTDAFQICLDETDSLLNVLKAAGGALEQGNDAPLNQLAQRVTGWAADVVKGLKLQNAGLTQFNLKVVENTRMFEFRLEELYRYPLGEGANVQRMVVRSIIMHLIRNHDSPYGLAELVNRLEALFQVSVSPDLVEGFQSLNRLIQAIGVDLNLKPVIAWCEANHEALVRDLGSDLEFQLHKLQFLIHYHSPAGSGRFLAYKYAREHFPKFGTSHLEVILKLLSALLYEKEAHPYQTLMGLEAPGAAQLVMRQQIVPLLTANFCALELRLPPRLLLEGAITAAYRSMPQFIKFHKLLRLSANLDWTTTNELPFETPYDYDDYHQVFICPVSKEQTVAGVNPPMSLPCRHILSQESIWKLSRNLTTSFKCPYCPEICTPDNAFEVKFVNL